MKNSEKGFTYPLTLSLLLLFQLFIYIHIEQLLTERKMAHETATILQQEYYFLSSVKKLEAIMDSGGVIPSKGSISYLNGRMDYQGEPSSTNVQMINFTLYLNQNRIIIGRGFFDVRTQKLIKWVELK